MNGDGPADQDQKLSEARAQAVVDHLMANGIAPGRLEAHGYGAAKPNSAGENTVSDRIENQGAGAVKPPPSTHIAACPAGYLAADMDAAFASDFVPVRTRDGSFTLRSEALDEQYHSLNGAVQESAHVFIEAGLHHVGKEHVDLLEVGLGTGLNALLTWIEAERLDLSVNYDALEPEPLPIDLLELIDHPARLGAPDHESYLRMMTAEEGRSIELDKVFRFRRSLLRVQGLSVKQAYDLVYFDAFAPEKQADMWTEDVFERLFNALRPKGVLVTYCAKGEVRRRMLRTGFSVERLPGPPGKREMLRATRAA